MDANGAFAPAEAPAKLAALAQFELHSIEQPAGGRAVARRWRRCAAHRRCPVALDEELIGLTNPARQEALLDAVRPPTSCSSPRCWAATPPPAAGWPWPKPAASGWWMTSALESNIGLNAVAQLTGEYAVSGFAQGLGTGQLYDNNVGPCACGRHLHYDPAAPGNP
ncbi:MAG: hypothetical protein WKG07_15975 [Hymenobacter sp.]